MTAMSTDDFATAMAKRSLTALMEKYDGSRASVLGLLTDMSKDEIEELGGVPENV
jgi:hypothetical protein